MFMLYGVAAGIFIGLVAGGRLGSLAELRIRWAPLAFAGLLVQLALFWQPVADAIGAAGPPLYVASTAAVFVVVLRNVHIRGLPIVAVGAASNLAAIVANGGFMPASPSALASVGESVGSAYTNSVEIARPALAPLTDIFAMPSWLPFANIFSVGDVAISIGIAVTIAAQMLRQPEAPSAATATSVPAGTSLQRADPLVPRGH